VNGIAIKKVETSRDLRRFIRFAWRVYAGDPNWVPPLIVDMKDRLNRKTHPFFEHGEADYFLALRNGKPAGRIAAVVDRHHNECHDEKTAFFGLFESLDDPEVARSLLDTAAAWGLERGMDTLRGPANLSMNVECGFLLEGFDKPPAVMMPYNPRYYHALLEASGFVKAKDLYAFHMKRSRERQARAEEILSRLRASDKFTFRSPRRADLPSEARRIAEVYNEGWRNNWGFVPWTEAEMDHLVRNLARLADLDLVLFAEDQGRTAGFAFALPDYNQVLARMNGRLLPFGILKFMTGRRSITGVRALVFGVKPEYMRTGLAYLLYDEFEKAIIRKGYEWCELSWQLEDNHAINRFAASIGAVLYKKYRIYEKRIASGGA
jgi:GNAT superfamily N-acetyltransferase